MSGENNFEDLPSSSLQEALELLINTGIEKDATEWLLCLNVPNESSKDNEQSSSDDQQIEARMM